jgi:hypothetical protein
LDEEYIAGFIPFSLIIGVWLYEEKNVWWRRWLVAEDNYLTSVKSKSKII